MSKQSNDRKHRYRMGHRASKGARNADLHKPSDSVLGPRINFRLESVLPGFCESNIVVMHRMEADAGFPTSSSYHYTPHL